MLSTPYNNQLIAKATILTNPAVSSELEVLTAEDGVLLDAPAPLSVSFAGPLVTPVDVTLFVAVPFAETSATVAMVMLALATHLSPERILAEALNVMSAHCS